MIHEATKREKAIDLIDFIGLGGDNRGGRWTKALNTFICVKMVTSMEH